jgi:hypothetical protein
MTSATTVEAALDPFPLSVAGGEFRSRLLVGSGQDASNTVMMEAIEAAGYKHSVGLEYIADGSTEESLGWLPREHRGGIHLESLSL